MWVDREIPIRVVFFRTEAGVEPVRDWLKSLSGPARKKIGEDIKTVQFGWPMGMPLVRKLEDSLWEVRTQLDQRTARVIFTAGSEILVLLHGFIKKTPKTPLADLNLARKRLRQLKEKSP